MYSQLLQIIGPSLPLPSSPPGVQHGHPNCHICFFPALSPLGPSSSSAHSAISDLEPTTTTHSSASAQQSATGTLFRGWRLLRCWFTHYTENLFIGLCRGRLELDRFPGGCCSSCLDRLPGGWHPKSVLCRCGRRFLCRCGRRPIACFCSTTLQSIRVQIRVGEALPLATRSSRTSASASAMLITAAAGEVCKAFQR